MKLQSLKIAALAFAGLAALAQSANATNVSTATGDLILGVYETNSAATGYGNTYEVDLGSLSNFSSTDVNYDLGSKVSITDLNTIFGSSLSSASWFVAGTAGSNTSLTISTPNATSVYADAVLLTDQNVPGTYSHNGLSTAAGTVGGLQSGLASDGQTANSIYASDVAVAVPSQLTSNNNFGIAASGTSVVSPTGFGSVSALYLLNPASNLTGTTHGQDYDLGNFQFVGGTDFVYNYQAEATPEPSTYALMGLGALALVIMARRRMASNL